MLRVWGRIAVLTVMGAALAGCASEQAIAPRMPAEANLVPPSVTSPQSPLQCVPYARVHSGVKLFGDAWTWWDQAAGKFPRESAPEVGAVMVLQGYAGPQSGHVAVVRSLLTPREIRVDHANWLDDGAIYVDDPVADVSNANDWSAVRVWNIKTGAWGGKIYPVRGFIGPAQESITDLIARSDSSEDQSFQGLGH
jgi:hypothetical protein